MAGAIGTEAVTSEMAVTEVDGAEGRYGLGGLVCDIGECERGDGIDGT